MTAFAQAVSVLNDDREHGYGFMFEHFGNCYVVLPRHVAGQDFYPRINLSTASPVVNGTGAVFRPFWDGMDLVVAVASEALKPRCTASLDDLALSRRAQTAGSGQLLRLLPDGSEERVQIEIEDRGYLTFNGRVAVTDDAQIAQGTSGAFVFAFGEPIGMAITSNDNRRATFMRSEEIHLNLSRYLAQSGGALAIQQPNVSDSESAESIDTLPLALVSSSVPSVSPSLAPENMLGDGLFVFEPTPHMVFDFRFESDEAQPMSRLRIVSPSDDGYALPKNILVQVSAEAQGGGFRTLMRGQASLDGALDTGDIAPRFVRRIRIVIIDAWSDGAVAIDRVVAY